MSRNAQQLADRLRSALGFHTHQAKHVSKGEGATAPRTRTVLSAPATEQPGEAFARRLREAVGA